MSVSTIGVLGLGLFGSAVARTLAENNVDVIAIDKNMDHVEEVLDEVPVAIQGDFTKIDHLMEAGFADCDEVIIATAEKLEDSIIAILNLKKLGIEKITVKTKKDRKSTRLNSSHVAISYAVFCLKKKKQLKKKKR